MIGKHSFLLPLLLITSTSTSTSAFVLPRNESTTQLGASHRFKPQCDGRTSGMGINFQDCYLLAFSELGDGHLKDSHRYWYWANDKNGEGPAEIRDIANHAKRHLPYPREPWHHGRVQAQLDIVNPWEKVQQWDDFPLTDVKQGAVDLMNECCRHKMGGTIQVAGGIVSLKITPYHAPYLALPPGAHVDGDDGASMDNTSIANGSSALGTFSIAPQSNA